MKKDFCFTIPQTGVDIQPATDSTKDVGNPMPKPNLGGDLQYKLAALSGIVDEEFLQQVSKGGVTEGQKNNTPTQQNSQSQQSQVQGQIQQQQGNPSTDNQNKGDNNAGGQEQTKKEEEKFKSMFLGNVDNDEQKTKITKDTFWTSLGDIGYKGDDDEVPAKIAQDLKTYSSIKGEYEETKKNYDAIISNIETLPQAIKDGISEFMHGGDWRSKVQEHINSLDFSKPFSDMTASEKLKVIKNYDPSADDITVEDLSSDDAQIKRIVNLTKAAYEKDFNYTREKANEIKEAAKRNNDLYKSSLQQSLEDFKKSAPFAEEGIAQVQGYLGSSEKLLSLFFDESGLLKKDAAKRVALALYGEDEVKRVFEYGKKKGAEQQLESTIQKSGGSDLPNKGAEKINSTGQPSLEEKKLKELSLLLNKKPIY